MAGKQDTCANCEELITGEPVGVLSDGPVYSWRHTSAYTFGCGGRADRHAPQAIPVTEVTATCTVHQLVTVSHACEAGGTVTFPAGFQAPDGDGPVCAYLPGPL